MANQIGRIPKAHRIIQRYDEMGQIRFQVYRQPIQNIKPEQLVTLFDFLMFTQEANCHIQNVFFQIAQAEAAGDLKEKARLKQRYLHYFTPCCIVNPTRAYKNIKSFTGLLVLDFDHLSNAPEFKRYLFETYSCIAAAWLSPSKRGVKALVNIPLVNTINEFKEYFFGIANEMRQYNGFDETGKNCVLPLFQSYDPDLLDRHNPETWIIKGSDLKAFNYDSQPPLISPNIRITDKHKETVLKIINTGFKRIISTGHPQLRSLCLVIGGYVGAGYIDRETAQQMVNYRISLHPYLKKGIKGYQETARWAINEGMRQPLYLK